MLIDILKSYLIGICAAAPLGPIAILVLQKTLHYGHRGGFTSALGSTLVDTTYAGEASRLLWGPHWSIPPMPSSPSLPWLS